MNPEHIESIVSYIQQYPDESTENLVKNLMSSGYTTAELKEALRKLGISPIVIPGYKEPDPLPANPLASKIPIFLVSSVIIVLMLGGGVFLMVTMRKPVSKQAASKKPPSAPSVSPTIVVSPAVRAQFSDSEIQKMNNALISKNYRIEILSGDIPASSSAQTSINRKRMWLYSKMGELVKIEFKDGNTGGYVVIDGKTYGYLDEEKSYFDVSGSEINKVLFYTFYPKYLLSELRKGAFVLAKSTDGNFKGSWKQTESIASSPTDYSVSMTINPSTHLIEYFLSKPIDNVSLGGEMVFRYEEISDIDKYTILPPDYKNIQTVTPTIPIE